MVPYIDIHSHGVGVRSAERIVIGTSGAMQAVGIHPWMADQFAIETLDTDGAIAIGEIGLDYRHKSPDGRLAASKEIQKELFERQIRLAATLDRPMIIHSVGAFEDTCRMLRDNARTAWVWHGFGRSSEEAAKQILSVSEAGFLSFGAALSSNHGLQQVFKALPAERLFLETDDHAELDIRVLYALAAHLRHITVEELKQIIANNFRKWIGEREPNFYWE